MRLLATCLTVLLAADLSAQTTALTGANVIDGTGRAAIPNAVVLVRGDRIACIGTAAQCAVPADARRVDLTGRYITPGLIDAHVHFSQTGWIDGRPDGVSAPTLYPYLQTALSMAGQSGPMVSRIPLQRYHRRVRCGGHPWTTRLRLRRNRIPWRRMCGPRDR